MLSRPKYWSFVLSAALAALPHLTLSNLALGQVLFSDSDFLASNYTTSTAGGTAGYNTDIRFNLDYSSFSIFDGYLNIAIPPSPRGGGSTTGLFMTGNNDSLPPAVASSVLAAVTPNGVNVGTGTANPNYVLRVDVFNSTGNGIDNGSGTITGNGQLTTYSYVGINQANTTVQIAEMNFPGGGVNAAGQGIGMAITADGGAVNDFLPVYGGVRYIDRALTDPAGIQRSQALPTDPPGTPSVEHTGLISRHLANYWETQGFEFTESDDPADTSDNLVRTTGDGGYITPDPADPAGWTGLVTGPHKAIFLDAYPKHDTPLHYSLGTPQPPSFPAPNTAHLTGGTPYNQWATHELYWVDGTFTYVVTYDGKTVPLLQFTPGAEDMTIFDPYSSAGTAVLAFYDQFSSVAVGPEGANFVVFDNLEIEVAGASDVPSVMQYLTNNGYTIAGEGLPGDFNGDEKVDGRDFLLWQRDTSVGSLSDWQDNYGAGGLAAVSIPEPTGLVLLVSLVGAGLISRRR